MSANHILTEFAPAERASYQELHHQTDFFINEPLLQSVLDAVPDIFLILNQQRQIVFANKAMLQLLEIDSLETIRGMRPGEALGCIHATESMGGCGTTEFCSTCGAVQAIVSSLRGKETVQECRISQANGESLDLRVWATPLQVESQRYSLFAVNDISHEKRRQTLERIFFHDILNTAGNIQGVSWLLQEATVDELDDLRDLVHRLSENLVAEIQMQRTLLAAENNELSVSPAPIETMELLTEMLDFYQKHDVALGKSLALAPNLTPTRFVSDRVLVGRVLGNMIKNALEASRAEEEVTLGCRPVADGIMFWVHNVSHIPRKVQLQIFQRSFSTKGTGRGLGTYSIKLLSEQYLQGQVGFITSEAEGTTFWVRYPHTLARPVEARAA